MKRLTLPVLMTQDDIMKGVCAKPERCAITLALKRAVKNRFRDKITNLRVHVFGEDGMHVVFHRRGRKDSREVYDMYRVPQKVLNFIEAFDESNDDKNVKKKIKPITFQFRGVDDAI